jgi:hypothetical protein
LSSRTELLAKPPGQLRLKDLSHKRPGQFHEPLGQGVDIGRRLAGNLNLNIEVPLLYFYLRHRQSACRSLIGLLSCRQEAAMPHFV